MSAGYGHVFKLTKIDKWFLRRLERIATHATRDLDASTTLADADAMRLTKQLGFSDKQLARHFALGELDVREPRLARRRRRHGRAVGQLDDKDACADAHLGQLDEEGEDPTSTASTTSSTSPRRLSGTPLILFFATTAGSRAK